MIHWIIAFSIRNRTIVVLTAIVCAIAGIYAAVHSPMDAVPDLSENQVIVFSNWPGHGPVRMQHDLVLDKISTASNARLQRQWRQSPSRRYSVSKMRDPVNHLDT